jgi:O-antigen/teichoic acid export membrane protein
VKQHLRRMGGFSLLPGLSMLASLVLLPLISARFGSAGWVALSLGQSVGAVVSIVAGLAWPVLGGNAVAAAPDQVAQQEIFRSSVYSRLLVLVVLVTCAVPLTVLLAPSYPWSTALFMLGVSGNALTAAWYFAGLGTPRLLVVNEGVVRFGAYLTALAGLTLGAPLIWYAACTAATGVVTLALNWRSIIGRGPVWVRGGLRRAVDLVRAQLTGTLSRVLRAVFIFGGPPVFAGLAPLHLPLFSALDQVQKAGTNTLAFLPDAFVHWVGSAGEHARRRIRQSLLFLGLVSLALVPGWMLLGPTVVDVLYAGRLTLHWPTHLLLVVAIAGQLIVTSMELLLMVPLGCSRAVYRGTSVVSLLGLVLLGVAAPVAGAVGGVAVWVVAQALLVGYYLLTLRRGRRNRATAEGLVAEAALALEHEPGRSSRSSRRLALPPSRKWWKLRRVLRRRSA